MTTPLNTSVPVELLSDQRGVYGIGVSELFDLEALAWACGIEPEETRDHECPRSLILRPDRLANSRRGRHAVLQKINGGFPHSVFRHSIEERLRRFIHHEALNRAGLPWPQPHRWPLYSERWWSSDKRQQARNRGVYHGLRMHSLHVINHLIGKVIEEAADADAIKAARRFAFEHREYIYRAGAQSRRALQLASTFPVLAIMLYSDHARVHSLVAVCSSDRWKSAEVAERKCLAVDLVERGARLRDVAATMGVPMALRRIKPGVAHLAFDLLRQRTDLLHYMPDTVPRSRIWLRAVNWAHHRAGAEFSEWTARHITQIRGGLNETAAFLSDIADWVGASQKVAPDCPFRPPAGWRFVTRPFAPSMSLKTVTALSADWHEAVANNMDGTNCAFPRPWHEAAKVGDFEIIPIENSAELYREGNAMHHCVGTYTDDVQRGRLYVYSVRHNGERVATFALARKGNRSALTQIRGPCNSLPPKNILATVQRWLRAQGPLPPDFAATARDVVVDEPVYGHVGV
jgi:hypothetical protein